MLTTSKNVYKTLINLWNKQVEDYKGPDWAHLTAEAKQKHEKESLYEHPWLIYTATKLWRKSTTGANWLQGHSTWRTQEQKIKTGQGTTEDNQHQLNRINNKKKGHTDGVGSPPAPKQISGSQRPIPAARAVSQKHRPAKTAVWSCELRTRAAENTHNVGASEWRSEGRPIHSPKKCNILFFLMVTLPGWRNEHL